MKIKILNLFKKMMPGLKNAYHKWLEIYHKFYYKIKKGNVKRWFQKRYKQVFGTTGCFETPKKLSEIIYAQMLYLKLPIETTLVDKIAVKKYLTNLGYSDYCTKTICEYENPKDINLDVLPSNFVIKANHDSGSIFLVTNNKNSNYCIKTRENRVVSEKEMKKSLKKALSTSMFFQGFEWQYKGVTPKIFVEEMLFSSSGFLKDFKIFCNYGKPIFIFLVVGRQGTTEKTYFIDPSYSKILFQDKITDEDKEILLSKPKKLCEMLSFASDISKTFPLSRVDLYYDDNFGIRFGEIAFSHYAGFKKEAFPQGKYDLEAGEMFEIQNFMDKIKEVL